MNSQQQPPKHLSEAMQSWWTDLHHEYDFTPSDRHVLQCACEAWDRMVEARELLAADGIVQTDRFGQKKPHPAVNIERDARAAFIKAVRELALSDETEPPRPPRLAGRYN